jgi:aspartate/methionine/tyrosine aminotransferase
MFSFHKLFFLDAKERQTDPENTKQFLTYCETGIVMDYRRMPIEVESPEQMGYDKIRNNLSESSYTDTFFRDIDLNSGLHDLLLCYGSHAGHDGLRDLLARDSASLTHGSTGLTRDDVLLTIGAAGALFIIATALLEKDDELIVVRPNYATNIETPRAIGAGIRYIDLRFEEGFALDIAKIKTAITAKTKYISVTYPHNPTGACLTRDELQQLAALAEKNDIFLLVDETYRDMVFGDQLPLAATCSPRIISVSSLSKTYGLPGLRTGWIICQDQKIMQTFLAAKEQVHICGPTLEEEIAFRYLQQKDRYFPRIREDIRRKFGIVKSWIQQQNDFEWVEPAGGCVCFPRLAHPQQGDIDRFYRILLEEYGTYAGPGHWFGMPRHYMRIGFGWPSAESLQEGLTALTGSWQATVTRY